YAPRFPFARVIACLAAAPARLLDGGDLHEDISYLDLAILGAAYHRESAALHHQNRRQQALRAPRDEIQIEGDEPLACRHFAARLHVRLEALPAHAHRIDADVHEDLGATVAAQRDRVLGFRERDDLSIARRMQHGARRIHREPVAQHSAGEDRVRDLIEWRAPAGKRREEDETALRLSWTHVAAGFPARGVRSMHSTDRFPGHLRPTPRSSPRAAAPGARSRP